MINGVVSNNDAREISGQNKKFSGKENNSKSGIKTDFAILFNTAKQINSKEKSDKKNNSKEQDIGTAYLNFIESKHKLIKVKEKKIKNNNSKTEKNNSDKIKYLNTKSENKAELLKPKIQKSIDKQSKITTKYNAKTVNIKNFNPEINNLIEKIVPDKKEMLSDLNIKSIAFKTKKEKSAPINIKLKNTNIKINRTENPNKDKLNKLATNKHQEKLAKLDRNIIASFVKSIHTLKDNKKTKEPLTEYKTNTLGNKQKSANKSQLNNIETKTPSNNNKKQELTRNNDHNDLIINTKFTSNESNMDIFTEIGDNSKVKSLSYDKSTYSDDSKALKFDTIIKETIKTVKNLPQNSTHSARFLLKPKQLGTLFVKMELISGVVNIKLEAETKEALKVLEGQIGLLKDSMTKQGIKSESINLALREDYQKKSENYGQRKGQSKKDRKFMKDFLRSFGFKEL